MVGWQEGHSTCKKLSVGFVGGDWSFAYLIDPVVTTTSIITCCCCIRVDFVLLHEIHNKKLFTHILLRKPIYAYILYYNNLLRNTDMTTNLENMASILALTIKAACSTLAPVNFLIIEITTSSISTHLALRLSAKFSCSTAWVLTKPHSNAMLSSALLLHS